MRIRSILEPAALATLLCCIGMAAIPQAWADDGDDPWQIHIGQINPQDCPRERGRIPVSPFQASHLDPRIGAMVDLGDRLSQSTIVQRGNANMAVTDTRGFGNVTGQFQVGSGNFSGIGIDGFSNKVVTFQTGNQAYSDIDVIGGNKTIYHMQFGATQRVTELPFTGSDNEKYLIIDKGRYGAYIARIQ